MVRIISGEKHSIGRGRRSWFNLKLYHINYYNNVVQHDMRWEILLVLHWRVQVGLLLSRAYFDWRGDITWSWFCDHMTMWSYRYVIIWLCDHIAMWSYEYDFGGLNQCILSTLFQITSKGGWTCNGVCSKMASSYNFCEIRGKASFFEKSWWDFCTPK